MGLKLPGVVSSVVHTVQRAGSTIAHGAEHAAKSGAAAISHAADSVAQATERSALVAADKTMRAAQTAILQASQHTFAPTLGKPNPGAGVGRPPVVLLAGQGDDAKQAMRVYANSLQRDGFKVFVFDDPDHALESHGDAAKRLDTLVDRIRSETGATKVDLVGYSTGGTNARAYVNLFGGADKVGRVVQVAGTNNGDPAALGFAASGREEQKGSAFIADLNARQANVPVYSIFERGTDGEVQADDARLQADALRHNVELPQAQKDGGFVAWSDHVRLPFDPRAYQAVVSSLTEE